MGGARAAIAGFLQRRAALAEANAAGVAASEGAATTVETLTSEAGNGGGNLNPVNAAEVSKSVSVKANKPSGFKLKTPGGIAALLLFALFLVFAITPARGHASSRLRVLWDTLINGGTFVGTADAANEAAGIKMPDSAASMEYASKAAYVDSKLFFV